jgi:hypothetical protein
MAALLVICADVVADLIRHIIGHFTSIFVVNNDFIGNQLPMLLPIIPPGAIAGRDSDRFHLGHLNCNAWEAHPSEAANFHKEQTPNSFMTDILNNAWSLRIGRTTNHSGHRKALFMK